jgi:protein-S-isoprenylcysteine O-methyltransferase Ste14
MQEKVTWFWVIPWRILLALLLLFILFVLIIGAFIKISSRRREEALMRKFGIEQQPQHYQQDPQNFRPPYPPQQGGDYYQGQ